jgi:uncharacterized secreted protein with C-terminal beta-propeller domain
VTRARLVPTLAVAVAMAAGCTTAPASRPGPDVKPTRPAVEGRHVSMLGRAVPHGLVRTEDCVRLLATLKAEALREVTAYGLPGSWGGRVVGDSITQFSSLARGPAIPMPVAAAPAGAKVAHAPAEDAAGYSSTNNQEAGVDEPDLAKTDGRILALLREGPSGTVLHLVDVSTPTPSFAGRLQLEGIHGGQLFLTPGRVVVLGSRLWGGGLVRSWAGPQQSKTRVVVVDISDPTAPTVERRLTVPGALVDARLAGGRVVTVTQSTPLLHFGYPRRHGHEARRDARLRNRQVIERSTLDDWVPSTRTGRAGRWPVDCGSVYRPRDASGLGSATVTSVDPASDAEGRQVTVLADAGVVYASTDALYLATNQWSDRGLLRRGETGELRTYLHGFDLTRPDRPTYLGSGSVRGSLVDKYALSEYDGYLRVATTVGTAEPAPGEGVKSGWLSNNRVVVLHPEDGRLVHVGHVGDFGRGERIYSVRFLGPLGYVVTFRQIDPLFVLDLSEPTAPVVRGELQMPGYSSYLHPLGDDLLFGLGQDVDSHLAQRGVQTSVFDVSDLASPRLVDKASFPRTWTAAEEDPHQFLWWPAERLVVLPVSGSAYTPESDFADVVLHVSTGGSLDEVGRVHHPAAGDAWGRQIERALVIGDVLYTVSRNGVLASDLDSLASRTWLPFR